MTSTPPDRALLEAALRDLPAGVTAIVRTGPDSTTLTLRSGDDGRLVVYDLGAGARRLVPVRPEADPELPGAHLLADPSGLGRRLEREVTGVRVLAYRPRRRVVARLTTAGEAEPLYLKLLTRRGYRRAERCLPRLPAKGTGIRLLLPSVWLRKERALVAPAASGTALHDGLRAGFPPDPAVLAAALRSFAALRADPSLPQRGIADERRSALAMLEGGALLLPELAATAALVRDAVLPEWTAASLVHTDLHDKQIFLGRAGADFIDLEGAARGDPRLDWVNLVEHLRLRGLQWGVADRFGGLRDGLRRQLGLVPDAATRRVAALVRARLAGVYGLRPPWHRLARRLAAEAARSLA